MPGVGAKVGERRLGRAVLEVVGPASQDWVDPVEQDRERLVRRSTCQRSDLGADGQQGLLRRIGVDIALGGASLLAPLDMEAQKVEALVDVGDPGFRLRQAQAYRGERCCDFLT